MELWLHRMSTIFFFLNKTTLLKYAPLSSYCAANLLSQITSDYFGKIQLEHISATFISACTWFELKCT